MVLTLVVAGDFAPIDDAGNDPLPFYPGRTTVFIVDTVGKRTCGGGGNDDESWIDAQPPLTMWVRANGKSPIGEGEIFAGAALPHRLQSSSSQCAWRYDFEPTYPGTYLIHVKVLNFNGFFDSLSQPCTIEQIPSRGDQFDGQTVNASIPGELETLNALNYEFVSELAEKGNYLHHRGLAGFKMYDPEGSCCDACKRSRNCKMFTVPGATNFDQCELYFDRVQDDLDFLDRNGGHFLGRERNYSYLSQDPSEFPSIRRRGRHRHLVVSGYSRGWWTSLAPYQGFPPPTSAGTVSYFIGCGWSSTMTYER